MPVITYYEDADGDVYRVLQNDERMEILDSDGIGLLAISKREVDEFCQWLKSHVDE